MYLFRKIISIPSIIFILLLVMITFITGENPQDYLPAYFVILFIIILAIFYYVKDTSYIIIPIIAIFCLIIVVRVQMLNEEYARIDEYAGENITFAGIITDYPSVSGKYNILKCSVMYIKKGVSFVSVPKFSVLVKYKNQIEDINKWDTIIVSGKTKKINVNGNFDYKRYLNSKGICGVFIAKTICKSVKITDKIQRLYFLPKLRQLLLGKISSIVNKESYSFLCSIFFGDRSLMDKETENEFKNTGMIHLLAISGFHVSFLGMILFFIVRPFSSIEMAKFISMIFLFLYVLLLNNSVSAIRAVISYSVSVGYFLSGNRSGRLTPVSVAGILLLIINPYSLYDAGFILSFIATSGIILYADIIMQLLPAMIPDFIRSTLSVTVAAFVTAGLIQWSLFGKLPFFSLVSSVIIIPLFTFLFAFLFISFPIMVITGWKIVSSFVETMIFSFLKTISFINIIPSVPLTEIPEWFPYFISGLLFIFFYIALPVIKKAIRKCRMGYFHLRY